VKRSDYSRGFLELDGRVPVGAELDSINGHNVKSSRFEKIMSFFNRKDMARFKLSFRVSSLDNHTAQHKKSTTAAVEKRAPKVDHQIRSEKLDVAAHRRSAKQKFKMAIRRWRLTNEHGSTYVEYEVVCALKTGDSIKRWTVWKRYSQFRRLHREIQKSFGWQFKQCKAEFPAKTFFNDISPAFNESRMEALNAYFKRVRTIPKIMEFDKHHSCAALRDFLEYEIHYDKKVSTSPTKRLSSMNSSGSGSRRSMSRNRYSSRRGMRSSVGSRHSSSSSGVAQQQQQQQQHDNEEVLKSTPSPPPTSSSSDDPRFSPFKKMLQMHLPEGAVRHKMVASGFTDQEIDSFLGSGGSSSSSTSNTGGGSSNGGSVREDPRFAKFTKMLQMHLPMGAIRHKMAASGFDESEIEAFASNTSVSSSSSSSMPKRPKPTPKPTPKPRPSPPRTARRPAPVKRKAGKKAAAPGDLLASIQGFNKKKLKKKGPPKKKKPVVSGPKKGSMAAILQAKLKARSMRLRKRESSHEVKRAAIASRNRKESERRSSFASSSSNDDW